MNDSKILSISIAAYNVEKYLDKTISSLIDTKIIDKLEIIIVNDGSTDSTLELSKKYKDRYQNSIFVIDKKNGGYGSTINCSINYASGKYFKQLDGDDFFITENIASFLNFLERCNSDLVISPFVKYYEDNAIDFIVDEHIYISENETKFEDIDFSANIAMHELTIKTALLKNNNIRITENCFYTDNEYTFFPLQYAETVCRFYKPIYVYRLGREGQSISLSGARKHYKDTSVVAESMIKEYEKMIKRKNLPIILKKLSYIIDSVYTYHVCAATPDAKKELMDFDKKLKIEYKNIYLLSMSIKKVAFLRLTNFLFFNRLGNIIVKKW